MTIDKRIQEAIDACRPNTDDLQFPELTDVAAQINNSDRLARLMSRVQAADKRITEVMGQGTLPEGIEQRLLDRLEMANQHDRSAEIRAEPTRQVDLAGRRAWWRSRRALLLTGIAAALLIGVTIGVLQMGSERLTLENLDQLAEQWHKSVRTKSAWRKDHAPDGYLIPERIRFGTGEWQSFTCPVDRSAVAFDVTRIGDPDWTATLFVIRTTIDGLYSTPPASGSWTLGRSITAWQSGDVVYVLVIEGPQGGYRQYVDTRARTAA